MGVQIQPVSIWYNGQSKQASELDARIIFDDLDTTAQFYYELKEAIVHDENGVASGGLVLSVGNVTMNGQDYIDWDNSNSEAYVYIAGKLNLTIA
jgi:hypothetical protein